MSDTPKQRTIAERRAYKFRRQHGRCHWCNGLMTLTFTRGPDGHPNLPGNFATFEHLHRRRDGGVGKPHNVVLACRKCNGEREDGQPGHYTPPKPENLAAWRASKADLQAKLAARSWTPQELGECYRRGLLPNWPMWSSMMAHVPLGNP